MTEKPKPSSPTTSIFDTLPGDSHTLVQAPPQLSFSLAVYHPDGATVVPLEPGRPIVVGRSAPSDLVLDKAPVLSRQHARFTLERGVISVEDLGSTNGTRIDGQRVDEAEIHPGQTVHLSDVRCVVHTRDPTKPDLEGLGSHEEFQSLVMRNIVECKHFNDEAALLMMHVASQDGALLHVSRWYGRVRAAVRPVDVLGMYGGTVLEALLVRCPAAEAEARAKKLIAAAEEGGGLARCGIATFPGCGTSHEKLVQQSRAALTAASFDRRVVRSPQTQTYTVAREERPLIANSAPMVSVVAQAHRMATARLPILLLGETGTGKEVLAQVIHHASPRSERPLAAINCGAIPHQLIESTLFGHVRGAFTGAERTNAGTFASADGGTVLLDEIGELPPSAQTAVLRVLETGRFTPVGATQERKVDVRIIAATHRDLEQMCVDGSFREDLMYRINAATISIPPLRERREDIPTLVSHFIKQAGKLIGTQRVGAISPSALNALLRYRWPGNVRELRNVIERACVVTEGQVIELEDLPSRLRTVAEVISPHTAETADLRESLRSYEIKLIDGALRSTRGNTELAARRLNLPRRTLAHKMKGLGLDSRNYSGEP